MKKLKWKKLLKLFTSTLIISAFTFGGGYVIVPVMKKKFVDELCWLEEEETLDFIAIAQSSPSAIAVNASILLGYRIAGLVGAVMTILGTIISLGASPYSCFSRMCFNRSSLSGMDCTSSTMNEEILHQGVVKAINRVIRDKEAFIAALYRNIESIIGGEDDIGEIDVKLEALQTELLQLANSKESYDGVVGETYRLRELKGHATDIANKRRRISEAIEYVDMQDGVVKEFDDILVRKLVEKVTVYDDRFVVEFKSGGGGGSSTYCYKYRSAGVGTE